MESSKSVPDRENSLFYVKTSRCYEENGRVIVKRVERPDGMTEYSLEYMPPIMISDGKYLKEEHLNLTTYTKPCSDVERRFNQTVELMVEEIRCFRYIQSVKKDFSFLSLNKDVDVIGYFESHGAYKRKECYAAVKTFKEFCNNSCRFGDVSVAFMMAYREYLLKSTKADGRRRYSTNTASGYLKNIMRLLRIAYADHMIDFDPTDEIEGIKWDHTCKRERLTSKEIEAIKYAPFKDEEVKKAVRFDIACGLRQADLLALRWENLEREKRRYYMCITIKKTGNNVRIPLSKEAVSILRPIRRKGAIFPTLSPYILNRKVPLLIETAGIDKHITFHCFRHTFATLQVNEGTDIYTVSHLLTHANVGTTQIYADIVDKSKRDTVERIKIKSDK